MKQVYKVRGLNPGKTPRKLTVEAGCPADAEAAFKARFTTPFKRLTFTSFLR